MKEEEIVISILENTINRWDVFKEIDKFVSEKYNNKVVIRKTYRIKLEERRK